MTRAGSRVGIVLCAAVVAVAGCSRGGGEEELSKTVPLPDGISPCEEVFGPGLVIDPITFGEACSQGEEMVVPRPVTLTCADQRVLVWNDFAWGYEGQEMTMLTADTSQAEQDAPFNEAVECLKDAAPGQAPADPAAAASG